MGETADAPDAAEAGGLSSYRRSIAVTSTATLFGLIAGVISARVATGPADQTALIVWLGAALASFVVMRVLGVDITEFSTKDNVYVLFMSLALWFITFSIMLTGL
ncbi:MAG: hypothetical protein ABEJ35_01855 [Halobacteriaceae archaeon]